MPPLPADSIHARACKLKCEKILTRPNQTAVAYESLKLQRNLYFTLMTSETLPSSLIES